MQIGRDDEAIDQREDRLVEIDVEERLGRGKFEDAAVLIEAIEALLAQLEQVIAQGSVAAAAANGNRRTSESPRAA